MTLTLVLFVFFASLAIFFGWRGSRAPDLIRGPRLLPHRFLMILSATAALYLLVHLINLFGFNTGGRGY